MKVPLEGDFVLTAAPDPSQMSTSKAWLQGDGLLNSPERYLLDLQHIFRLVYGVTFVDWRCPLSMARETSDLRLKKATCPRGQFAKQQVFEDSKWVRQNS